MGKNCDFFINSLFLGHSKFLCTSLYVFFAFYLQILKSVCSTWEDLLWAYTKCLVDTVVEVKIREGIVITRPLCELPSFYWENKQSIEDVFDAVNAMHLNEDNIKEAKIFHQVQRLLILNDIHSLYEVIDDWSIQATINEREILRFFAHLVILLRRLNSHDKATAKGLLCIRRYVMYLYYLSEIHFYKGYTNSNPASDTKM